MTTQTDLPIGWHGECTTPKEKTIEAACDELKHLLTVPCTAEHNKLIAEHLYEAGLLKEVE